MVDCEAGYAVIEDLGDDLTLTSSRKVQTKSRSTKKRRVLAHRARRRLRRRALEGAGNATWLLLDYDAPALEVNADLFHRMAPRAPPMRIDDAARASLGKKSATARFQERPGFARAYDPRLSRPNLLWLLNREGCSVGLLDFQTPSGGWRGWDFSMLLHDARRDVSGQAHEAAVRAYLEASGASEVEFQRELAVLGAINTMRSGISRLTRAITSRAISRSCRAHGGHLWPHA